MARIPASLARRARSTASNFLGTPSGSACACISIAPLRVCAFADSEKTRNSAASCDLMDVPFIAQVSLEGRPDPEQPLAPSAMCQSCYCTTRCHATAEWERDGRHNHFLTLKCRKSGGGWSFLIGIKLPSAPSIYCSLPMNTSLRSSVQLFSVHMTVGKRV